MDNMKNQHFENYKTNKEVKEKLNKRRDAL